MGGVMHPLNVFPSLKGGDFRLPEADVPARDEEIDCRVDVPVMPSTTAATAPLSYYEALSTLWAAACLEGNPPQGLSSPPSRPLAAGFPGDCELLAHRLHGIRVQAEELAAAVEINNPDAEFSSGFARFTSRPLSEVEPMCGVM